MLSLDFYRLPLRVDELAPELFPWELTEAIPLGHNRCLAILVHEEPMLAYNSEVLESTRAGMLAFAKLNSIALTDRALAFFDDEEGVRGYMEVNPLRA